MSAQLPGLSYGGRSLAAWDGSFRQAALVGTPAPEPTPEPANEGPLRRIDGGWEVVVANGHLARFRGVGSKRRALGMIARLGGAA